MIKQIDSISYANRLRPLSPMWKCGFAAGLFLLAYVTGPFLQLLVFLWMLLWTVVYAGVPLKLYSRLVSASCLLYVLSLPGLLLEFRPIEAGRAMSHGLQLLEVSGFLIYIPDSAWGLAAETILRILACLSCMFFVTLTTPFPALLQVFQRIRMPHIVIELIVVMYRFIFLLLETAHGMLLAQRSRGGQSGFWGRLRDTAVLIVRLFGKTMQRYRKLSYGLMARGFTDSIELAPYEKRKVPLRYMVESVSGTVMLCGIMLFLWWRG